MLFNSVEFLLIFLPIVFFVYFALNKMKLINMATGWLVIASLYFYGYWNIKYVPFILLSMIVNYSIGSTLQVKRLNINRKIVLISGLSFNLLALGYYKYFNFFLDNFNILFHTDFNYMKIILPLGISFFTFQQMSYLIDSYRGETKEYDFLTYALFVTFFPQLIAGPIVHHKEMMPQFANLRNRFLNHKNISIGLFLIAIGLFKKVIIADSLSPYVGCLFDTVNHLQFVEAWVAGLCYTLQLYFDFSGYCDMALGLGFLFNISLPQNFNSPYKALDIQDFWRRWHMTLSRFLKDYLYIPLGGNRVGTLKTYRNVMITFVLCGLWHGANWTFVLWGFLHGIASCIVRFFKLFEFSIPKPFSVFMTFLFVNVAWVIFRAKDISRSFDIIKSMFGGYGFSGCHIDKMRLVLDNCSSKISILLLAAIIFLLFLPNSVELSKKLQPNKIYGVVVFLLLTYTILSLSKISEFLYFQF